MIISAAPFRGSFTFKRIIASVATLTFGLGPQASANSIYTVVAGDTLSQIAQSHIAGPVYGKLGSLRQIVQLNASSLRQANSIQPGLSLVLPDAAQSSVDRNVAAETTTVPTTTVPTTTVPTTTVPTTPAPTAPAPPPSQERSLVSVTPRFSFNELHAVDRNNGAQSTLASDLAFGAELSWALVFDPTSRFVISGAVDRTEERTSGKIVDPSGFTRANFSVEYAHALGERSSVSISASAENSPFVRAVNASTLSVGTVLIPALDARLEAKLARSRLFDFSLAGHGGYRFAADRDDFNIRSGSSYGVNAVIAQSRGSHPLSASLFFNRISQGTSLTEQSDSTLGFSLSIGFDTTPDEAK